MLAIFKKVDWFIIKNKYGYMRLITMLLIISFLATLPPTLVGKAIDMISLNSVTYQSLILFSIAIISVPISIYILNNFFHIGINKKGQELARQLRLLYLNKIFNSDSKLYEEFNKGELISRMSNDMPFITQAATYILADTIYCAALLFFVLFQMITTISFKLTLVAFLIIPLTFVVLSVLRNKMRRYYKQHRKIYADFYDSILETIEGQRVVRAYCQEDNDFEKNKKAIDKDIKSWTKIVHFESIFTPLFELTIATSTFLTFTYGSILVINSQITPGELVTFSMYITMVSGPILILANLYNLLNQAMIASERFYEVIERESEIVDHKDLTDIFNFQKIEFKNVSFKYPFDKKNTIDDISLTINMGQTIGIVGPTGSGKSTLIRQLLREFNITSGEILIDDLRISNYKVENIRDLVGYVPQVHTLFSGTVSDNLHVGNEDADQKTKDYAIDIAAFRKDINYLNDGMDTVVGESGNGLSGGQKQRLSIARAIIKNPEILILDDSLSAVDANTEKEIINNIKTHRKSKTNLIISHRFSVVKEADLIIVLEKGKITERGTHQQLMENKKWYYIHYLEQTKG